MSSLEARLQKLSLGRRGQIASSPSAGFVSRERNYINVEPAAIASRQGRIIRRPQQQHYQQLMYLSQSSRNSSPRLDFNASRSNSPKTPAIPKSQEVKKYKEPSYSTMLQLDRDVMHHMNKNHLQRGDPPLYVNYQNSANVKYNDLAVDTEEDYFHYQTYASPPSPVSSSYSELRQATRYPPGYHFQQMQLQQQQMLSNYESLYEPVAGVGNVTTKADLDYQALSSNSSESSDYFGLCFKCEGKIIGEGTGCQAMNRLYHIQCFTCHQCHCLLQGRPFYALDGQPFCEADYLETLEKCCKCLKPISKRILRATGKPYHPECFKCVACAKSLDGVPFTVDATNQIHCIPCFHRRFAPKCSVCRQPIMPEPGQEETVRVVALDRSFHVNCYRCEDCGLLLSSEEEGGSGCYPLDDKALCKNCNTKRIQLLTNEIAISDASSYPSHQK